MKEGEARSVLCACKLLVPSGGLLFGSLLDGCKDKECLSIYLVDWRSGCVWAPCRKRCYDVGCGTLDFYLLPDTGEIFFKILRQGGLPWLLRLRCHACGVGRRNDSIFPAGDDRFLPFNYRAIFEEEYWRTGSAKGACRFCTLYYGFVWDYDFDFRQILSCASHLFLI